jgi:hypothetical protein
VFFELYEGNRLVYAIFFATKHERGCGKMKEAIWKIAPFGDFEFRGSRTGQIALGLGTADLHPLKRELVDTFHSRGWIGVAELERWIQTDATNYCGKHLKGALRELEEEGLLSVDPTSRTRARTYPAGTRLAFVMSA